MTRYFNRSGHSLAVMLNDSSTAFVRSKGVLVVQNVQISADLHSKVKKGLLVRMGNSPEVKETKPAAPVAKTPEKESSVGREVASEDALDRQFSATKPVSVDFEDVFEDLEIAP